MNFEQHDRIAIDGDYLKFCEIAMGDYYAEIVAIHTHIII